MDTLNSKELDEIQKALIETAQETMAVCPEKEFKELYLPVFSGKVVNDRAVHAWIYLAGGPLKRVKVVNDAQTEVLFEVPSWFSTNHMSITAPKDGNIPSFGEVVSQALLCMHNNPRKANKAFEDSTISYLKANISAQSQNAVQGEWEAIFTRYGINQSDILDNFRARFGIEKPAEAPKDTGSLSQGASMLEDGFIVEE